MTCEHSFAKCIETNRQICIKCDAIKGFDTECYMQAMLMVRLFNKELVNRGIEPLDGQFLLTWFISAMQTGYDQGRRER